jgi:hypothetical protein
VLLTPQPPEGQHCLAETASKSCNWPSTPQKQALRPCIHIPEA